MALSAEKTPGKIWVGSVDYKTTSETLRNYFAKFGDLVDAVVIQDRNGRSRGFGFVVYRDPEVADKVLKDKHTIDGRQLDLKKAVTRDEINNKRLKTRRLFIGALTADTTTEELRNYFVQFGPLDDCVVMLDRNSMQSRGFGFVTYDKEETAEAVLAKEHMLKGARLEVKKAEPKREDPEDPRGRPPSFRDRFYQPPEYPPRRGPPSREYSNPYPVERERGYATESVYRGYPPPPPPPQPTYQQYATPNLNDPYMRYGYPPPPPSYPTSSPPTASYPPPPPPQYNPYPPSPYEMYQAASSPPQMQQPQMNPSPPTYAPPPPQQMQSSYTPQQPPSMTPTDPTQQAQQVALTGGMSSHQVTAYSQYRETRPDRQYHPYRK